MKSNFKFGECFLTFVKIWGCACLAFIVSLIPLYIWRGTSNDKFGENLILSIVGLVLGFVFLALFQAKSDEAEKQSEKETCIIAACAVGIYLFIWLVVYFLFKNNYFIALCGYNLECLFGVGEDDRPKPISALIAALIFGATYFLAIIVGGKIARHRHKKQL